VCPGRVRVGRCERENKAIRKGPREMTGVRARRAIGRRDGCCTKLKLWLQVDGKAGKEFHLQSASGARNHRNGCYREHRVNTGTRGISDRGISE
jgi:hypothetical protein